MTQRSSNNSPAVQVNNLQKTYKTAGEKVTAVNDISFKIYHGEIVALLGPNGAGKTTAVKSILGLIEPTSGTVEICGLDVSDNARTAYRNVGVVLEGARNVYWRLTVRENLEYFTEIAGKRAADLRERHDDLLKRFDLTDKADDAVRNLSRGMKQKVALAVALARNTPVIFLDEPTLGLDVETSINLQQELRRLADEDDCGIMLTSHNMDVIEATADRVVVLSDGQVVVNNTVDTLFEAFRTQSYELFVEGNTSENFKKKIGKNYMVRDWKSFPNQIRIVVTLDKKNDIYDLLGHIIGDGGKIHSVNMVEPDFSEIFLQVTDRNKHINISE